MSLYNMLNGMNPLSDIILATLGLTRANCGRFRDVFITNEDEIAIYTRNGGGNRDVYQEVLDALSNHPDYLRDEDDSFDSTYCTIYFKFPEAYVDFLKPLTGDDFEPDAHWEKIANDLNEWVIAKFKLND